MTAVTRRHLLAFAASALVLGSLGRASAFEQSQLTIRTATGERHKFIVELALTPEEQAQGLMFRETMAPDAGMLFYHQVERRLGMWMKNTVLPLDMLFIGYDGTILTIVENTVPFSETVIAPQHPSKAVLELNAGTAARLSLAPGDKVMHPLLVP